MQIDLNNPFVAAHPLNRGRVVWWYGLPNNSGGSTAFDLSPSRGHGSLIGPPPWVQLAGGVSGHSLLAGAKTIRVQSASIASLGIAGTAPFSYLFAHRTRSQVSLSQVWGFGPAIDGTIAPTTGTCRYTLQFNSHYYFWGSSRDWDTGINWDADYSVRRCGFTYDGTNLRFWRDGVLAAGPAIQGGGALSTAGAFATVGSSHPSAATDTNCDLWDCSIWNRQLSASEIGLDYQYHRSGYLCGDSPLRTYERSASIVVPSSPPAMGRVHVLHW